MRKLFFVIVATLVIFSGFTAYALDTPLVEMHNKIFEISKEIKPLLLDSKDVVLLNCMWDSCIMTMTQLDAYFSMVGIFNAIKREDISEVSVGYLNRWLGEIKKTNELNIKSLDSFSQPNEETSLVYIDILKKYYSDLNEQIDAELGKVSAIEKSLKYNKPR